MALFQYQFGGSKSKDYEHTLKLDELKEITISADSLGFEINFVPSTDGSNSIRFEGRAKEEIINQIKNARAEDGRLNLRLKEKWHIGFFDFSALDDKQVVTVSLTEETKKSLEVFKLISDSGSIKVNDAAALESVVESDSGSVKLSGFQGNSLSVKSDSGSIKLDSFEGSNVSLTSDSGSIHAGTVHATLKASSDSGSITVDHLNGASVVKSDSGSIRIVKDDTFGADVKSDSGSVKIEVPASFGGSYDLKSDSGSEHAPDPKGTSSEVIKVRTDSGSIRVTQP